MSTNLETLLEPGDTFARRHIGPSDADVAQMLRLVGYASLDELARAAIPASILSERPLALPPALGERAALSELSELAQRNQALRSFIGQGYYGTITPAVILRNVLENPGYYTQYTPYQAEISQGRLEALLNFQTMVSDLTGLPLANASLLDEATAAAEAMTMCRRVSKTPSNLCFVADDCHPQTIAVLQTRAAPLGIEVEVGPAGTLDFEARRPFALLLQYPATDGRIVDYSELIRRAREAGTQVIMAADLLALTLLRPPGELGADVAIGSTQRFGVPLGFGGPHAAFMSARAEYTRQLPGRIVGVSHDATGRVAYRLAIQTREQHIRRDRATSNICTAQVLLAITASMYALYHGPAGLRQIALRVRALSALLRDGLVKLGLPVTAGPIFDTLRVALQGAAGQRVLERARSSGINLRSYPDGSVGVALDETASLDDVRRILAAFAERELPFAVEALDASQDYGAALGRQSEFLTHPVFNSYHSEHELLRYVHRLQSRDLSLTTSMIPLGSCTMKLNATSEMLPITWPEFADMHPFSPEAQVQGYGALCSQLAGWLAEITGLPGVSLQPNSGAQGEYAGLLVIRAHHRARGEPERDVCLIPVSAHGTNPASAVMAGFRVIPVACDERGNVNVDDLRSKAEAHRAALGALMLTYPSTHGVFEAEVRAICRIVHEHGGQVYLDGANMNAQVGLCRPGEYGADVCHLNLHKTFCIPHGGGGPGMGPIAVAEHLIAHLPGHPSRPLGPQAIGPVSAAAFGSPGILPIPWMYIRMMGGPGLRRATEVALLNANYMMKRLSAHYPVLYAGEHGLCAHEFILDARPFKKSAGIEVEDIAKRLMDYGFHAPTMSFPVPGTLMIEPTESESRAELDRLCDALIAIREEIRAIEAGQMDARDNPLKNAPHTADAIAASEWTHPYSRSQAAFPAPWTREYKYWPPVGRIDNAAGDRNLFCVCPPLEAYAAE